MTIATTETVNSLCYDIAGHIDGAPDHIVPELYDAALSELTGDPHHIKNLVDTWVSVRRGKINIVPRGLP